MGGGACDLSVEANASGVGVKLEMGAGEDQLLSFSVHTLIKPLKVSGTFSQWGIKESLLK